MLTTGDGMKKLFLVLMLMTTVAQAETYKWTDKESSVVSTAEPRQSADDYGSVAPKVEELKERMLNDEGIMALIRAMQNDPEMQALLNDPAVLRAIQAMDINTLINNPTFMKMLNNPRVQEIEKRMH
jgi:hypothetical protein